jgi:hypothetical protein
VQGESYITMGNYYGGEYLEARLGETKKAERTTVFAETHDRDDHIRLAIIGYEWRVASDNYRREGLTELRIYGSVMHEGLAPLIVINEPHLLSDDEHQYGVSLVHALKFFTTAQLDELKRAIATPGQFKLMWPLSDKVITLENSPLRRYMQTAELIYRFADSATDLFLKHNPDWTAPEKSKNAWEKS